MCFLKIGVLPLLVLVIVGDIGNRFHWALSEFILSTAPSSLKFMLLDLLELFILNYSQILALYWSNSVTRFYRILVSSSRDFTWHGTLIFLFKVQTLLPNNHYKFSSLEICKVSKMLLWVYLNDFYWIKFKMWFQEIFSSNAVLSNLTKLLQNCTWSEINIQVRKVYISFVEIFCSFWLNIKSSI